MESGENVTLPAAGDEDPVIHETCGACKDDRAAGRYWNALECHRCKGKGIVRKRESWVCNRCGGGLCPETTSPNSSVPHGLVEATVSGGYDSPRLSDSTWYKFSLCEACLRTVFETFKVPPQVGDYMMSGDISMGEETYAREVADRKAWEEKRQAEEKLEFDLRAKGACIWRFQENDKSDPKFCGERSLLRVSTSGAMQLLLCGKHGRNAYARRDWTIHTEHGENLTFAARAKIGRHYLEAFARGEPLIPSSEHIAAIYMSTLYSLVAVPRTAEQAAGELFRLSSRSKAPTADRWVGHRIAEAFPPGMGKAAALANAWLIDGQEQGYAEAVAHAMLGYDAKSLWAEREPSEESSDAG